MLCTFRDKVEYAQISFHFKGIIGLKEEMCNAKVQQGLSESCLDQKEERRGE